METVLITGASSGLGYEFAKLFAEKGYDLVISARREERLNSFKKSYPNIIITLEISLQQREIMGWMGDDPGYNTINASGRG